MALASSKAILHEILQGSLVGTLLSALFGLLFSSYDLSLNWIFLALVSFGALLTPSGQADMPALTYLVRTTARVLPAFAIALVSSSLLG